MATGDKEKDAVNDSVKEGDDDLGGKTEDKGESNEEELSFLFNRPVP